MKDNHETLCSRFEQEMKANADQPVELKMTTAGAWVLLSQLQLALRHPNNVGLAAEIAKRIAKILEGMVAPPGTARAEVAEMGWQEQPGGPRP